MPGALGSLYLMQVTGYGTHRYLSISVLPSRQLNSPKKQLPVGVRFLLFSFCPNPLSFVSLLVFSILFPFYDVTGLLHCYAIPTIIIVSHFFIITIGFGIY